MARYTYRPDPHFVPHPKGSEVCPVCFDPLTRPHDHKPDKSGLDDGPYLDEYPFKPRKKAAPKHPVVVRASKLQGWETRREKYGPKGHR